MTILTFTVLLALVATVVTLAWGLGSMAHGGSYDDKHAEQLMFLRIALQAVAFVALVVAVFLSVN